MTLLGVSDEESPATRWRCMLGTKGDMDTLLVGTQPPSHYAWLLRLFHPKYLLGSSLAGWDGG